MSRRANPGVQCPAVVCGDIRVDGACPCVDVFRRMAMVRLFGCWYNAPLMPPLYQLHDYGGEPDAWPHVSSSFGSIDYAGFPKAAGRVGPTSFQVVQQP